MIWINFRHILLVIAGLAILLAACDELDDSGECEQQPFDCIDSKPGHGPLIISSTINSHNTAVPIKIFRGDFELNDLILDTVISGSGFSYVLPVDQYYSVVAEYVQADGDTVIAIDGDDIEVDETDYCEGPCYEIDEGRIDVKLKFPKATHTEGSLRTEFLIRPSFSKK